MFNHFLNTHLMYYYSSLTKKKDIKSNDKHNQWLMKGIKISCKKKELFYCVGTVTI
jgi:hypothetical protein